MKSRVDGAIDKFCCKQTATFFCCVLMKNVASGPLLLDENMKVGAIFMDLSKTLETLNHRLVLAKLKTYGLQPTALRQMENYLQVVFKGQKM